MLKGLKKKKIKNDQKYEQRQQMHNYQQPTLKKLKEKLNKQTTRTGPESQKWRSHGGVSVWRGRGRMEGKGTGNKKHNS